MSRSPKSSLDRVITSVPQDATAARVTAKGTHYTPKIDYGCYEHRDIRPPMVAPEMMRRPEAAAFARSIIGKRIGRLTVLGMAAEQTGKAARGKAKRWVVRCDCGGYEFRKAKSIRNGTGADMCRNCLDLEIKKHKYKKHGSKSVEEFTAPQETKP